MITKIAITALILSATTFGLSSLVVFADDDDKETTATTIWGYSFVGIVLSAAAFAIASTWGV